jgi:nucleoid-associated protein YgaU
MKKVLLTALTFVCASLMFAVSYKNNTYQKLANEYTKKAQNALDAGDYLLAEDYAKKAEENAALSEAYIKKMLAKSDAEAVMKQASAKLDYAKSINADRNFPMAFSAAQKSYASADDAFKAEDYTTAAAYARQVLDALADIKEITPLPQYYVVRPWAETKDCYWNISGRPYVYNNPLLWENLYQANKSNMPKPNDPNLILPGMKMEIPSITGEYREGVYSPSKKYDGYSANK